MWTDHLKIDSIRYNTINHSKKTDRCENRLYGYYKKRESHNATWHQFE